MPSFIHLFTVVATVAVAVASASVLPDAIGRLAVQASCLDAQVIHSAIFNVGDKPIRLTSLSCGGQSGADSDSRSSRPLSSPRNVCNAICTTSCNNNAGVLPPISEDCDAIKAAVQILQNDIGHTFTVRPGNVKILTYETCNFFFSNTGPILLESCWSNFSADASVAGSACFPPVHPFSSVGMCSALDGTWAIGASHS